MCCNVLLLVESTTSSASQSARTDSIEQLLSARSNDTQSVSSLECRHSDNSNVKSTLSDLCDMKQVDSSQDDMKQVESRQDDMKQVESSQDDMKQVDSSQDDMKQVDSSQDDMKQVDSSQDDMKQVDSSQDDMKQVDSSQDDMKQVASSQDDSETASFDDVVLLSEVDRTESCTCEDTSDLQSDSDVCEELLSVCSGAVDADHTEDSQHASDLTEQLLLTDQLNVTSGPAAARISESRNNHSESPVINHHPAPDQSVISSTLKSISQNDDQGLVYIVFSKPSVKLSYNN